MSERIKVEAAASYQGMFSVSAKLVTQHEREQAETFAKNSEHQKTFTIGSKPPSDGKAETWVNQAIEEPMPIKYRLKPVSSLFDAPSAGVLRNDVLTIKENMKKALKAYCHSLQKQGSVVSCKGLPDDPKAPVIHNSCRFCAQRCGGYYPVDGGAISQDAAWEGWFQSYPPGCSGTIGHYPVRGRGARFCCEPKDESHLGKGRICQTCGPPYIHYGGKIMSDANWPDWVSVYDDNCGGDARHRPNYHNGFSLCFTEKPLCELCASCGGAFPQETSVLAYDSNWPAFFKHRGSHCKGSFGSWSYSDGVKLCCKRRGPTRFSKTQ